MTAKEYLRQIYILRNKIQRLKRRRDDMYEDLYSIGSPAGKMDIDKVQTSMSGDTMLRLIARIDKADRQLVREIEQLEAKKQKIMKQIEAMPNEQHRSVLYHRYVLCWKWSEIAADMVLDERWVYRIHGQALAAFGKQFNLTSERQ